MIEDTDKHELAAEPKTQELQQNLTEVPITTELCAVRKETEEVIDGLMYGGLLRRRGKKSTFNRSPKIRQIRSTFGRGYSRDDC